MTIVSDEALPMVVLPVMVKSVKVPAAAVVPPMMVLSMVPPPMSTVLAVRVPVSVSSLRRMPPSRISSSVEARVEAPVMMLLVPMFKLAPRVRRALKVQAAEMASPWSVLVMLELP